MRHNIKRIGIGLVLLGLTLAVSGCEDKDSPQSDAGIVVVNEIDPNGPVVTKESSPSVTIDPAHLESLFEVDGATLHAGITPETLPEDLEVRFDLQQRLVYLTADGEDMAIYGVQTGGYATDYIGPLFDAGWMLHSTHLWQEQAGGDGDWTDMISSVYEQDDQELVLTGRISEDEIAEDDCDYIVTEITLLSRTVVDELADEAGIDAFIDETQTPLLDPDHPEAQTLGELADEPGKYRLSSFCRLIELEG